MLLFNFVTEYITAENATLEVLQPLVAEIQSALGTALVSINGLVGEAESVILGVEGEALLTVLEVATAIAGLLTVSGSWT